MTKVIDAPSNKISDLPRTTEFLSQFYRKMINSGIPGLDHKFWQNHECILQEISDVTGLNGEEINQQLETIGFFREHCQKELEMEVPDSQFLKVCKEIYEQEAYPILEHFYYARAPYAIKRKEFVLQQICKMDTELTKFCDLGVGPGVIFSAVLLNQKNWQGYGVDISSKCVEYANKMMSIYNLTSRSHIKQADVRSTQYPDDFFDVVIATEVLEHLPKPIDGLREVVRILKPNAFAIIGLPTQLPQPEHLYVFSDEEEVKQVCHNIGLIIEHFETWKSNGTFIDCFILCKKAVG